MNFKLANALTPLLLAAMVFPPTRCIAASWPDLSSPAHVIGGGEHDAAVVIGIQSYVFVPGVPGAKSNANEWYQYLAETRNVPQQNIKLLTNEDATREEILDASRKMSERAGKKGTLWFVFVGHGAPSADGKDGLLIGVDAQQKAESLQARSVRRGELLNVLAASPAGAIRVVLDACFSGRGQDGAAIVKGLQPLMVIAAGGALDPRMAVLTAAKGNQFAGPLPGAQRPAFSYLVLGGLRGWAADAEGKVTAGSLWKYATNALSATLRGRDQTPDLIGAESSPMGSMAKEKGPNLSALAQSTAGASTEGDLFKVSSLAQLPSSQAPGAIAGMSVASDFRELDMDALQQYNEAVELDESRALPADKASKWRELAKIAPQFRDKAEARAIKWERYAQEQIDGADARRTIAENRDRDWDKLSKLLLMKVVPLADKKRWAMAFFEAYGKDPEDNPYLHELSSYLPAGTVKPAAESIAGIHWVTIPGGTFNMGSTETRDEKPIHAVKVRTFQIAKAPVTRRQYQLCVQQGKCTEPSCHWPPSGGEEDLPVVCVNWNQAKQFSNWTGGRLPSEAEWEYAARSGGKEWKYPWGSGEPSCTRAVIVGCGNSAARPICSKPDGNTKQGLCDMGGNVWQWTEDLYYDSYNGAPIDGSARGGQSTFNIGLAADSRPRSFRGGSWKYGEMRTRAASRSFSHQFYQNNDLGFRPAR